MRHSRKIYFLFFIGILLSCSNNDTIENSDNFLTIQPTILTLNVDAEEVNKYFTVKSDKSLQVNSDNPDWCKPTLSNVSIDNLKIAVSENQSSEERRAVVTVSNGLESKYITIVQAGVQADISVDKSSVLLDLGKREFALEISSNVEIAFELPEWIVEKEGNSWGKGKRRYRFSATDLPDELLSRDGVMIIKLKDHAEAGNFVQVRVFQKAITKIIAHRGFWSIPEYPQNSLASLQRAIDLEIYGSELDVWITQDGVVVLNHDPTINGINVENSTYAALSNVRLSNGEPIPTLENCIEMIKKSEKTKLIIEIKPHSTTANENRVVAAVLNMVNSSGVADKVDYISFSQNVCKALIADSPQNRVAYLNGNLTPEALSTQGYWGLDYAQNVLKSNTGWVQSAHTLGLTTNVWTVNATDDLNYFIQMGVHFITTDYPQNLKNLLSTYQ